MKCIAIHKGVARISQRGGSYWVIQRVLTRLSPEYCGSFACKKAYKGGGHGHLGDPPGYDLDSQFQIMPI